MIVHMCCLISTANQLNAAAAVCVQEDLIGAEQEGRHDEKRRAKLHAAWLEQQDNAQVEQLLHGVKNGFRRRRNALDDEVPTHMLPLI